MERKTYTIYDNYDVCSEELLKEAKEDIVEQFFDSETEDENGLITVTDNYGKEVKISREDYAKTITDEKARERCYFWNECNFDDSLSELARVDEGNGIIAIADIGRWNGRCGGYKEIKQLCTVMYSSCDYERVYVDSNGDLRKSESHHDGNNSILYRYWKDGLTTEQKDNFLTKIYNGECTQKDITRYTRKAGLGIAEAYGWKVRGLKRLTIHVRKSA